MTGTSRLRRVVIGTVSKPWALLLLVAAVAFVLWVISTRSQSHEVRVAFPNAVSVVPGLDVQANGVDVGKITSVAYEDGQAIVGVGIDDEDAWPLHEGTTATLRYGTTAGNGTRRVDLVPGPRSAPEIPEGGVIESRYASTPVEFDEIFRMLDGDSRDDLRSLVGRTAQTLDGRAGALNEGIEQTAPALEAAGGLLGELADDDAALDRLVTDTHRAVGALASRQAQISDLVSVAGATFSELGANSQAVRDSIGEAPSTLRDATTTLARVDRSVDGLETTVRDAAPAAAELPRLAAAARPTVRQLSATAPRLTSLLRTGRRTVPAATRLVTEGTPFARRLTPILKDLAPVVGCIRPYAPELAGWFSNWASFSQNYDGAGHYARIRLLGGATSLTSSPELPTSFMKLFSADYANPRPPGLNAGQPWLLPQCGVTADALDASKDPEDKR